MSPTRLRPVQVTLAGLALGAAAAALIVWRPELAPLAAVLVLGAWLLDRVDGNLARRQRTASAWGAWLDAAVDELLDVGLHVALAAAAASRLGSAWPWGLVAAFLGGKYLLVHGLGMEEQLNRRRNGEEHGSKGTRLTRPARWLRAACHLPGNADVRVHLLALALASGWFCVELALVAAYYNLRWIARYFLVARRLGGER